MRKRSNTVIEYIVRDDIDLAVLDQIYVSEQYDISRLARGNDLFRHYEQIIAQNGTPLIVDCGAHIGASANYFLERFPLAKIIAIEPEPGNFRLLTSHCRSDRIDCMNVAVSSELKMGKIIDPGIGNWGFRVEEAADGDLQLVTINGLLDDKRYDTAIPFIMKIDIEGFERDLFARNTEWLERFPLVIVELHDWMLPGQANSRNFLDAVSRSNRDFVYIGENVFSISNSLGSEGDVKIRPPGAIV